MAEQDSGIQQPTSVYGKAERFFNDNKQQVNIGIAVAGVVIAALLFVKFKYIPDRDQKAQLAIYEAQYWFEQDSFALANNGNFDFLGFEEVQSKFSFTPTSNLAGYYSGLCHLHLGNFDDAVKQLKGYNAPNDLFEAACLSALGDAYMESGQTDKGLSAYKKAANASENEFTAPYLMLKAGMALESQGKYAEAKEVYGKLKFEYPLSSEGRDVDKYLARVAAM